MYLYLVRHGQSDGNAQRLFFGWTDYALTPLGRAQAAESAAKLREVSFSRCVSSDLSRARETARICLAGHTAALEHDPRLREQNMGALEGASWDDVGRICGETGRARFVTDWFHHAPPGGEAPDEMSARVGNCLDELITRGDDTLLVAHNGSLSLALRHLGLVDERELMQPDWAFHHGCYSAVEVTDGSAQLLFFNR